MIGLRPTKLTTAVLTATLFILPLPAESTCAMPSDTAALDGVTVSSSALTPAGAHPILDTTAIASGASLKFYKTSTLSTTSPTTTALLGNVQNTPNPVQLSDMSGTYAVFVVRDDGVISSINPSTGSANWHQDLGRSSCGNDMLQATPVVHLRRYASSAFQAAYSTDLVYVATRYASDTGCTTGHNRENRVYALNAEDGTVVWTFNGSATVDMDIVSGSPFLAIAEDKLIVASERTYSSAQKSLWALDVLTGTAAWSINIGRTQTAPIVRDDKIYISTVAGEIKSIELDDGTVNWTLSGGVPITTNVFVEFRSPYDDLIATVDLLGRVWVVRDDGSYGTSVWKNAPDTGVKAKSRPVIDAANAKVYVGADNGKVFQLNLVDGSAEAAREVDSGGGDVGSATFVWEDTGGSSALDDLRMLAGADSGALRKFCAPWTTDSTTYATTKSASSTAASATAAPLPGECSTAADCGTPTSECYEWTCKAKVCVANPLPYEGMNCADGNINTFGDTCHNGTCTGQSDCQSGAFDRCTCTDENGQPVSRAFLVSEQAFVVDEDCTKDLECNSLLQKLGGTGQFFPGTEVVQMRSTTSCVTLSTGVQSALYVHLFDQNRIPFHGPNVRASFRLVGNEQSAGTKPVWLDKNGQPMPSADGASTDDDSIRASSRLGTYIALLTIPNSGEPGTEKNSWAIELTAEVMNPSGGMCAVTTAETSTPVRVASPAAYSPELDAIFGGCPLDSNDDSAGFLRVRLHDKTTGKLITAKARVQVGWWVESDPNAPPPFYDSLESFITPTNPAGTGSNVATTDTGTVTFVDYGYNLNGGPALLPGPGLPGNPEDMNGNPDTGDNPVPPVVDGRLPIYVEAEGYKSTTVYTDSSDVIINLTP